MRNDQGPRSTGRRRRGTDQDPEIDEKMGGDGRDRPAARPRPDAKTPRPGRQGRQATIKEVGAALNPGNMNKICSCAAFLRNQAGGAGRPFRVLRLGPRQILVDRETGNRAISSCKWALTPRRTRPSPSSTAPCSAPGEFSSISPPPGKAPGFEERPRAALGALRPTRLVERRPARTGANQPDPRPAARRHRFADRAPKDGSLQPWERNPNWEKRAPPPANQEALGQRDDAAGASSRSERRRRGRLQAPGPRRATLPKKFSLPEKEVGPAGPKGGKDWGSNPSVSARLQARRPKPPRCPSSSAARTCRSPSGWRSLRIDLRPFPRKTGLIGPNGTENQPY